MDGEARIVSSRDLGGDRNTILLINRVKEMGG